MKTLRLPGPPVPPIVSPAALSLTPVVLGSALLSVTRWPIHELVRVKFGALPPAVIAVPETPPQATPVIVTLEVAMVTLKLRMPMQGRVGLALMPAQPS